MRKSTSNQKGSVKRGQSDFAQKITLTPFTFTDIVFDGEPLDKKTEAKLKDVSPGGHVIKLEKKGYYDWEAKINVSPGEEVRIKAFLTKKVEAPETSEGEEVKDAVAPSTPAQISPSDNFQVAGDTATLTWSEVSDPSGVTYSVEIQYRAGGEVGFIEKEIKTGLASPEYTYTMSGMMESWTSTLLGSMFELVTFAYGVIIEVWIR